MSVTNGNNSGLGSLRNAIDNHISNIVFVSPEVKTITLDAPLNIPRNLTIYGSFTNITVSNTAFASHVFTVSPGVRVSFQETNFVGNADNASVPGLLNAIGASKVSFSECSVKDWVTAATTHMIQTSDANIEITKTDFENNRVGTLLHSTRGSATGTFDITIQDCKITGNTLFQGALGCALAASTHTLNAVYRRLTFDANTVDHTADVTPAANLIYHGGGSVAHAGSTTLFEDIEMTNNTGIGVSPGIRLPFIADTDLTIRRVYIDSNTASGARVSDVTGIKITYIENAVFEKALMIDKVSIHGNAADSMVGLQLQLASPTASSAFVRNVSIVNNISTASTGQTPALALLGNGTAYHLNNVTVAGNTSNTIGGVLTQSSTQKIFRSVTIAGNHGPTAGGLYVTPETAAPILFNTLIADNWADPTHTVRSDVVGEIAQNSFNNLVTDGTGMTGITNNNRDNKVGTSASPIAAMLGSVGNHGGDNHIWSMSLLEGSPAINAGANVYVPQGVTSDSRGAPMSRIYGDVLDIGAFEWQPIAAPCFAADSFIRVKIPATGEVKGLRADEIIPEQHQVFDIETQEFATVKAVAQVTNAHGAYFLPRYTLSESSPFQDITLACCQNVVVDGVVTKVEDIPSAVKLDEVPSPLYAIVCERWRPIDVGGIGIYTWSGPADLIV